MLATLGAIAFLMAGPAPTTPADAPSVQLPLDLTWVAPPACPDSDEVLAEIRRRVGELDPSRQPERVSARVAIRIDGSGVFQLTLRTTVGERGGERALSRPECRPLAEAVALVLALLLNPSAPGDGASPSSAGLDGPPSVPAPDGVARQRPAGPGAPLQLGFGAEAVVASGVLPRRAEGLAGRVFLHRGRWELAAGFAVFLPQQQSAPIVTGARAEFHLLESTLRLCVQAWPGRRAGVMACVGGAVERLRGESAGVSSPGPATAYLYDGAAEVAGFVRPFSSARLRIGVEIRGLGNRPDFAILGLGSVFRPAAVNLRGSLGIDMLF